MTKPALARREFQFTLAEFSGALADLGVMLPLVLALIRLNGVDAGAAFIGIGLAYALTALSYRLPVPIQPLKSVSALALAMGLAPVLIVTAAVWNAVAFLCMGMLGLDRWVRRAFPEPVVRGIQLSLGYLLMRSAWGLTRSPAPPWDGVVTLSGQTLPWSLLLIGGASGILMLFLRLRRDWAALGVIAFGVVVSAIHLGSPPLTMQIELPQPLRLIPTWGQLLSGLWLLALPQIPLSLANSIFATADAARQYFGPKAMRVTERRLMVTMGASDLLVGALGGVPVCHGSGGLTAHYRLGARSGGAPLMIGVLFLGLGLLGSAASMGTFGLIPLPVLGVLLAYVGLQHALLACDLRGARAIATAGSVMLLTILTGNMAIGTLTGSVFCHLWIWLSGRRAPVLAKA